MHTTLPAQKLKSPVNRPAPGGRPGGLHIMHVVLSLDVGGLERVVLNLAAQGVCAGHRVSILCLERAGVLAENARQSGVEPLIVMAKKPGISPKLVSQIRDVLREQRPDVMHTHQIGALLYAGRAARLEKLPVVHTEHGNTVALSKSIGRRMRIQLLWRIAGRHADRFCCVSKDIADAAESMVPRSKLRLVANGISVADFKGSDHRQQIRLQLNIPTDAPVVGIVARLSEEKCHDLLLKAFAGLRSSQPEAHLLFVGDGPCKKALTQLAVDLGITEFVRFAGYQSRPQRYLQAMDVFALTSRMEGMPLSILEAWATGLPVIASAVGGIPDLIEHGVTGLVFPSGDRQALQLALQKVLENPDLSNRLAIAGQHQAAAKFSTDRMARDYQVQYLEILRAAGVTLDFQNCRPS